MTEGHTQRLEAALAGQYKIERKLGEGGMATVYLAEDLKHERKVAIKILRPELAAVIGAERFLAEIKTTANLQHPHILPLFDSGESDGFLFYVMPYISGDNLRERIEKEGQLGVDEAVSIARDVAEALDYAHRNDIIHRDIKPANILLHDGNPVVADFGIALAISAAGGGRMTETGLSLGTPHYMSPEQASADRDLSARSDVYSLGCVLYEMLAGQPPHTGPSAQSILVRILTEDPRPIAEVRRSVPPHVAAAVTKSIEKLPADRFDTARQFIDALGDPAFEYAATSRAIGTGAATAAAPAVATATSWLADTRSKVAVGVIAVLALVMGVASFGDGPAATTNDVPVTRFDILDPDPDDDFGLLAIMTSISPDGRHIALQDGIEGSNEFRLWIRDMDGTELRLATSDENPFFPEFSPDGQLMAYGVEGAIKVVPVTGGTPRTIVRLSDGDATPYISQWADDGSIVFNNSTARTFFAVPAEGADSAEVLFEPGTQALGGQLLPGGRFLIYHTLAEAPQLRIADLEADTSWTLQTEGMGARYLQSGHVVYGHPGQSLFAFPLDVRTGQPTGRPVPLMDSVAVFFFGRAFDVARNGTLVYSRGSFGSSLGIGESSFVEVDTAGVDRPIALERSDYGAARYSPEGDRLAFAEDDQIVVFDLGTGTTTRLTVEGSNHSPVWSPDGAELIFRSERDGAEGYDLFRRRVDGTTDAERVTSLEGNETPYAWTAGDTIVFTHYVEDFDQTDIFLLHLGSGEEPTPYLNAPWREASPALSPDGRWLAYQSGETTPPEILVRAFPDASGRWVVSDGGGHSPLWSPDGRGIWYRGWNTQDAMFAEISTRPSLAVGARRSVLEPSMLNGSNWDVHPSGGRFVVMRSGDSDQTQQFTNGRFRVVINWFDELRAQGLLGGGN